jgi:ribonucleoside-diphosphate reductase alpha chain
MSSEVMSVLKRSGEKEALNITKIIKAISKAASSSRLTAIDPTKLALKISDGLCDGISTKDIEHLTIQKAANLVTEEPEYGNLAAAILASSVQKQVESQEISSFAQAIHQMYEAGLVGARVFEEVKKNKRKYNSIIDNEKTKLFEYFGLKTLVDRYLLRHPQTRLPMETPQYFFLRIAVALGTNVENTKEIYEKMSSLDYLPSSPTLFNAGCSTEQLSSCFVMDSPHDSLEGIYKGVTDVARMSKFSGGIGLNFSRIRSTGSFIKGTNGFSNGIVPWLKILDASVVAVNQCFAPDTLVHTRDGIKPIKNVKEGDMVLGISGKYQKVTETMEYVNYKPMVTLSLQTDSESVEVTSEHPVYTLKHGEDTPRWVPVCELTANDYVARVIPQDVVTVSDLQEADAHFYGMLFAGSSCHSGVITLTLHEDKGTLDFVVNYLKNKSIAPDVSSSHGNYLVSWRDSFDLRPIPGDDAYNWAVDAHIISPRFSNLPLPHAEAMVRGMIRAQGSGFSTIHRATAECLRYQLSRMGIVAPLKHIEDSNVWVVDVSSLTNKSLKTDWFERYGYLWVPVKSIEKTITHPKVYDLKVEGDESYMLTSALVHNGGRRPGACCVYLETWHSDIESFLELKDNTGDISRRTYHLFTANWVPDLFMKRVQAQGQWSLFDPVDVPHFTDLYGEEFERAYLTAEAAGVAKKTVKAQELYYRMMRTLAETGNGWMTFKDHGNNKSNQTLKHGNVIHSSNLCVAPETMILTKEGNVEIASKVDQEVEVWNGFEWSKVTVRQTGKDKELVKVLLSNGSFIECTPEHEFAVSKGYGNNSWDKVAAADLNVGTKLYSFSMPVIGNTNHVSEEHELRYAYANGFFCGDGTYTGGKSPQPRTTLYGEKKKLAEYLDIDNNARRDGSDRINLYYRQTVMNPKFTVPEQAEIDVRLSWFAGLLDSDGTVARNGSNESLQIGSVNLQFLQDVRMMLTTLGVDAKVTKLRDAGENLLPDGRGGSRMFPTQTLYRLLISSYDTHHLVSLGMKTRRLAISGAKPQRNARRMLIVVAVEWNDRISDTFCFTEPKRNLGTFNGVVTGQCTEIYEVNNERETSVCNLASIVLGRHLTVDEAGKPCVDYAKIGSTVEVMVGQLDRVIDLNFYTIPETKTSNHKWRPVGLGLMGLQDVFFTLNIPFDSEEARAISRKISETIYYHALKASCKLAQTLGKHKGFEDTRASQGILQFDLWGVKPDASFDWDGLKEEIKTHGLRNSLLVAIAPTATIASIAGCYECIEPQFSNLFKRETTSGDFLQVNRYIVRLLQKKGMWSEETRDALIKSDGSVQHLPFFTEEEKLVFRTVWEIKQRSLIDMAADRGAFICQSASTNLFLEAPTIGALSSMYMYAWQKGLKSTYYMRSRPASKIAKTTIKYEEAPKKKEYTEEEVIACSLDNPASCEACQLSVRRNHDQSFCYSGPWLLSYLASA